MPSLARRLWQRLLPDPSAAADGAAWEVWFGYRRVFLALSAAGLALLGWNQYEARGYGIARDQAMLFGAGALAIGGFAGLLIRMLLQQLRGRIEAERLGNASEAKFRTCFENLADGVLVLRVEPDGRLVYEEINRAGQAIIGRSQQAMAGRTPMDLFPPERAAAIEARMRQCIAEGAVITYACTLALAAGLRRLTMTLAPVRDEQGRIVRLVKSIVDVTDRDLLEEQLRHAQKMEAIGRLTAGIAHDFNNLLQAQAGSLELLRDEVQALPRVREFADIAIASTERAAQLTHHLLAFAGKQMLLPEAVAMAPMLIEAGEMIGRMIGPQIEVEVVCQPDMPAAYADRGQFGMSLLNLAINARDAMPRGGRLRIAAADRLLPTADAPDTLTAGRYIQLTVTDDGAGMDAATLERACDPFFSTKGALVSGLGLSMVQGFVRQSGGELRIVSALGLGTRIDIWLPAAIGPAPVLPDTEARPPTMTGRVLLVDDSPDVLLTTGAFLEGAGFDVVRAQNGDRALVVLAAGERFDALVTDYAMPALNGAELILQALHLQPSLAALIITGFAEVSGLDTLPDQVQVLRKPFRRDELIRRLRLLIARQGAAAVLA